MGVHRLKEFKQEMELIRKNNNGVLTPQAVLKFAKNPKTALHSQFEWDNTKAAEKYRLHQAQHLIIRIKMKYEVEEDKIVRIREYVSLPEDRPTSQYRHIDEVLTDAHLRLQFLESIESDIKALEYKLMSVSAVAGERLGDIRKEVLKEKKKAQKDIKGKTKTTKVKVKKKGKRSA